MVSLTGIPRFPGTERLGVSLRWGLDGSGGWARSRETWTLTLALPSSDRLWASRFPFETSVSSLVKWRGSIHLSLPEASMKACDVPGTRPLPSWNLHLRGRDRSSTGREVNKHEKSQIVRRALWSNRIRWGDGDWGGGYLSGVVRDVLTRR